MPSAFGMIDESIWRRDKEFRALPRGAQCTFLQLLSQRDVDCAGVLTLHVDLLAKGCDEITPEDIRHDLKTLETARFIFVDDDTDELLIRSYARRVSARSPNQLKGALKAAKTLSSPKLRHELSVELRRVGTAEAIRTADTIDPGGNPSEGDTEPPPNPLGNPSGRGIPSEGVRNPPSCSSVVDQSSPNVVGQVGVRTPKRPHCHKHPDDDTDENCRVCRLRRLWDEQHATQTTDANRAARTAFWAEVRPAPCCDEHGMTTDEHDRASRCPNHDWTVIANA